MGISNVTASKYLNILAGMFMIRILSPWYENLKKRQIKSPKIYFRDSGILHALLGLKNKNDILSHPKLGSFWEGFALEEVIRILGISAEDCYFWGTQSNAELDLMIFKNNKKIGFEIKYTEHLSVTNSMKISISNLQLDHLYLIYPGKDMFKLSSSITAISLEKIIELKNI